ncbi:unnamed protein product [Rotaria sp. Silwood2]|nr:unnamed protein product [Rotaria sp. Silwood2]
MSERGPCTDTNCDNEIKELYQCHCCLKRVCLTHLIEHVGIRKQNKQRLNNLRYELNTGINTLNLIVEEKLFIIKREQNLIEQAKQLVDTSNSTIDELQNSIEQINLTILSNRPGKKKLEFDNHWPKDPTVLPILSSPTFALKSPIT